tara:strand:+ start:33886 stop:35109 length:1224 start_codon:yes stop_codon:yes gene_type:complete
MKAITQEKLVRKYIRNILHETDAKVLLREDEFAAMSTSEFSKIFVEPFSDVFKAAKLGFKDVLTSTKFLFDVLVTIDPKKLKELRTNYKERVKTLKQEHADLRQKLGADTEDLKLAAFLLNPGGYLAASALQQGWDSKDAVRDFFGEAGFGKPSEKESAESGDKIKDPTGLIGTAFNALKKVFFFGVAESYYPTNDLLLEQGGAISQSDIIDVMEEMGILDEFKDASDQLLEGFRDALENLDEIYMPSRQLIGEMMNSKTLDEYIEGLQKASKAGMDLGGANPNTLRSSLEKSAKEFLSNPEQRDELIRALAQEEGKKLNPDEALPDVNEDELLKSAAEKIFQQSTDTTRQQLQDSLMNLQSSLQEELAALQAEFGIDEGSLAKTAQGKTLLDVLNDFRNSYDLKKK